METVKYDKYIDTLAKEFPDVDKKAIKRVVLHGLRMMSIFRFNEGDIFLNHNIDGFYFYIGQATMDESKRKELTRRKLPMKRRLLYRLKKTQYSGYFYFALNEQDYQKHLKKETIDHVILFKIQDDTDIYRQGKHIFRVAMPDSTKWSIDETNYETNNAEYLFERIGHGSKSTDDSK